MKLHTIIILWILMVSSGFMMGYGVSSMLADTPTIGGTNVPLTLDCEEDEVIGFVGIDTLDCVHIDDILTLESIRVSECARFYTQVAHRFGIRGIGSLKVRWCHMLEGA